MRIHRIRFENLNSLFGQWEIDFNDPNYVNEGIFAIIGPTGAGKTTLLDALCLGLYGQTPRLDKITKASNEIMSRQAGTCFAEVTFETSAGLFCATWRQHRARSRPDGDLQQPRHELVNAANGEVLESRLRDVTERIISVTGMDFQRFTRSMLLAQGNFASFLQAGSDERAPILEQITGTEIYTTISQAVHKRRAQEQAELQALQAKVYNISLLNPDEVRAQEEELQSLNTAAEASTAELAQLDAAVQWRQSLARLQVEAERLDTAQNDLAARQQAFQPEQARLRLARKALELDGDFRELESLRTQQRTESAEKASHEQALPAAQSRGKALSDALEQAQNALREAQEREQNGHGLFQQVRVLDSRLSERQADLQKLQRESQAQQSERTKALQALEANRVETARQQESLAAAEAELLAHKSDAPLVSELSGIRQQFQSVEELGQALSVLDQQKIQLEQRIQSTSQSLETAQRAASQAATACQAKREERERLNAALEALLSAPLDQVTAEELAFLEHIAAGFGQTISANFQPISTAQLPALAPWRLLLESLKNRADALADFSAALYRARKQNQALAELTTRRHSLTQSLERHRAVQAEQRQVCASREENVALWEAQSLAAAKIANLEQERQQLQANQPCPLCGALDHPFVTPSHNLPEQANQAKAAWLEAREQLRMAEKALRETQTLLATAEAQAALLAEQGEKSQQLCAEEQSLVLEAWQAVVCSAECDVLSPTLTWPEASLWPHLDEKLRAWQGCVQARSRACQQVVDQAEQKNTLRDQVQKSLVPLEARLLEQQKSAEQAEHARALLLQEQKNRHQEQELAQNRHQAALQAARDLVAPYVPDACALGSPALPLAVLFTQLSTRRDTWQAAVQRQEKARERVHSLALAQEKLTEMAHSCEQNAAQLGERLASLQADISALQAERVQLFGVRQPDAEAQMLRQAVLGAEKTHLQASEQEQAAARALEAQQQLLVNLTQRLASRALVLSGLEQGFARRLQAEGFTSSSSSSSLSAEAAYRAAQLPEAERQILEARSAALVLEQAHLVERRREHSQQLLAESARELSPLGLADLETARSACSQSLQLTLQRVGAVQQSLQNHAHQLAAQRAQLEAMQAQKTELERWEQLHSLIGSDSGKKFRNFAQGLTFDQVIYHANRQLCKMNDRYILVRDTEQPLDLNVADLYQAGEIRSTRNLSGGESFLVSLALALGLSQMASRNVRVDSLFLDEGFGTLDEEALETALSSLASLRQQGKLIGLISHVPAIRERLGVQIQVLPGPSGCSTLSGPGVRGIGIGAAAPCPARGE